MDGAVGRKIIEALSQIAEEVHQYISSVGAEKSKKRTLAAAPRSLDAAAEINFPRRRVCSQREEFSRIRYLLEVYAGVRAE